MRVRVCVLLRVRFEYSRQLVSITVTERTWRQWRWWWKFTRTSNYWNSKMSARFVHMLSVAAHALLSVAKFLLASITTEQTWTRMKKRKVSECHSKLFFSIHFISVEEGVCVFSAKSNASFDGVYWDTAVVVVGPSKS